MKCGLVVLSLFAIAAPVSTLEARTICTVVANAADGRVLLEEGDCDGRVTPASTFKIPLALMGFDSGFLRDARSPEQPFRKGYADWGGDAWKRPVDPTSWMKHSVVWYSQEIARSLGVDGLRRYSTGFRYGNADFSGDPGKNNALERAWISSSLRISPLEQVAFLRRFVNRELPVSAQAFEKTGQIVENTALQGGWTVSGKTGSAFPRKADGSFDRARGWGWFVGWATKGDDVLVFARLNQDEKRQAGSAGIRAKNAFLEDWPGLAGRLGR